MSLSLIWREICHRTRKTGCCLFGRHFRSAQEMISHSQWRLPKFFVEEKKTRCRVFDPWRFKFSSKSGSQCQNIASKGKVINLPVSNGKQTFGFTLSNVEADGPHGSFECLRQTGHRSIESLGCMQMKMHIHATEDSYENTKVKMASIEEQQKNLVQK
ncbi:RNA polymerase II elongation factor ELL2 [Caerostris extrusa]|uniref:RNA polymerase II elongation factor ELL2 n=1 Tax=Caerostris extrusa TaxID=172846 RepID=A0AAV4M8T0_CAEEX|nr:RNA polymerase II elongation factor ELL2 [Caerostris extrusa]